MKKFIYVLFVCFFISSSVLAQESIPFENTFTSLDANLERQKCSEYRILISEAISKYFENAVSLAKALKPDFTIDESFIKKIESTIVSRDNIINIESLIKKGYLKEKPINFYCVYYYHNSLLEDDSIKVKCPIHDYVYNKPLDNSITKEDIVVSKNIVIPCSDYLKDIAKSVSIYNSMYNGKMKELELGNLIINELLDYSKCPSMCLFTSVGDLSKDGYIKCLIHDINSKNIDEKVSLQNLNNYNLKYKVTMQETDTYKKLVKTIKDSINNHNIKLNSHIINSANLETANRIKIDIDLDPKNGEEALKITKIVQEFFTEYFIFDNLISQHRVTPITRIILNLKKELCLDYVFLIGNDIREQWIIDEVKIEKDIAYVKHYWNDKSYKYTVICKKINGNWYIDDVDDEKESFFSWMNSCSLGVVKTQKLFLYNKNNDKKEIPFNNIENRLLLFDKTEDSNYYKINDEMLSFYDDLDVDLIKTEDIIPFNFFNKIKKGEDKYLAYIVLGKPIEDSFNKLVYSQEDYICYDTNGKITSWKGFEDLRDFFDNGSNSNNQNIGYVKAKSGINLRKNSNTKSEKVCGLPYNTQVMILDRNGPCETIENISSNWFLITDGTKFGWAFGGFIEFNN